ncbi:Protein of unknown function (DUF1264) [Candidatus Methanoperedens nitroreducens]|uniref:Uncharacterized protein n=1 Tax=Candidatus Methanoperedens nitratireducens TaxID=1392998 RepID=A0A062V4L1_9EURY|nr:DUF1264 domain-containing protein [Candidatus Methanoperedens nitroreducens]KCZ70340.1 Protein of unknown function (DUF1264) [Candidatus Methanoperedens nitroreducens]MDJ1421377.1 DUF1264 domain-containing protein [Candidatus Methanoperedens sp.]
MKKKILIGLLIAVALVSIPATASNVTGADSTTPKPSEGWTLHVDAKGHFPSDPDLTAHHYCKTGAGGLVAQCQLYDSDSPNASLVGVEVVVDAETYNSFNEIEKALWHYHKDELSRVEVTFPDLPPEEAASVLKDIEDTYGKVYTLWDPGISNLPIGKPEITLHDSTHGQAQKPTVTPNITPAITPTITQISKPSEGWTLHIDAKRHFPSDPDLTAHHNCKTGAGGLVAQCQLYDSDSPNASLVGVEMIVDAETYNSFNETEKALWHYHRDEILRDITLPDLSPEEAASVLKSIEDTYGKIYILWDPGISNLPVGEPEISIAYPGPAQTPAVTPTITPVPPTIIPEFPTLAFPIAAVMVLILLLARRKRD